MGQESLVLNIMLSTPTKCFYIAFQGLLSLLSSLEENSLENGTTLQQLYTDQSLQINGIIFTAW
jgi:hypothetical protein